MRRRAAALSPVLLAALPALLLAWGTAVRAETPIPAPPERWVTDHAGFLSPGAVTELDARLGAYAQTSGHQILVYIDRTTGGVPIEDWGVRAFEKWRVGRKGIDDGLVMLVFSEDRHVRLEVGYGLEDRIPDAVAKRIIEERILPRIRAGDRDGAIRAGVDTVTATLGGVGAGAGAPLTDQPPAPTPIPLWKLIVGGLVLLGMLGFLITHPSLAWLLLLSIGSGRGGGGGWGGGGGGGGFSGGGGRSGGGGASGSW